MKILSNRLTFWTEANCVIDELQPGFRRGYSSIDNVFNLQEIVLNICLKRNDVFIYSSSII